MGSQTVKIGFGRIAIVDIVAGLLSTAVVVGRTFGCAHIRTQYVAADHSFHTVFVSVAGIAGADTFEAGPAGCTVGGDLTCFTHVGVAA